MKTSKHLRSILIASSMTIVCCITMLLSSCGGKGSDPAPTAKETATKNLIASPWKIVSVTVDGVDKTSVYTGLTITFSTIAYTTINGGKIWLSGSGWRFGDDTATTIIRSQDGKPAQLVELTETSLKISLAWDINTFGSGRAESVKGQHVFAMGK